MNAQVERLQALLQRVTDNRQKPRPVAIHIAGVPAAQALAEAKAPLPQPVAPARAATTPVLQTAPYAAPMAAPDQRSKGPKAPTPLELAVEGRISQPVTPQPVRQAPGALNKPPVPSARPVQEGTLLADVAPAEPSKPIMNVVSTHPPFTAQTFGELLRRSLSLRPR